MRRSRWPSWAAERRRAAALAELGRSRLRVSALHQEVAAIRDDLAQVIEGTNEVFVSHDRQLNIRSLNAAAAPRFGRPLPALLGNPLLALAPGGGSPPWSGLRAVAESGRASVVGHYQPLRERWSEVRIQPAP